METTEDIRGAVLKYVKAEYLEDDDQEINCDTPLISGGIVDSFSMVSLKRFLENKYKIQIPEDKLMRLKNLKESIKLTKEYL